VYRKSIGTEAQHVSGGNRLNALVGLENQNLYRQMYEATENLLTKFAHEARSQGKTFVLVIIPPVFQVDEAIRQSVYANHGANAESILKAQRDLIELGKREDFVVIDLTPTFAARIAQGAELYWRFNPHFNVLGNEVAAEVIADELYEKKIVENCG
jgi:hypothetical protein